MASKSQWLNVAVAGKTQAETALGRSVKLLSFALKEEYASPPYDRTVVEVAELVAAALETWERFDTLVKEIAAMPPPEA